MKTRELVIEDKKYTGIEIDLPGAPLVLVQCSKGFVMCGYLDIKTADKLNAAAAVVRGVKNVEELLEKPVADVSLAAQKAGVAMGMSGKEALTKLFK